MQQAATKSSGTFWDQDEENHLLGLREHGDDGSFGGLGFSRSVERSHPASRNVNGIRCNGRSVFRRASTSGGIGTVMGAIVGGLVMGVLNNGMSILGVGVDWQQAIKGLILLLAVVLISTIRKRKYRRRACLWRNKHKRRFY